MSLIEQKEFSKKLILYSDILKSIFGICNILIKNKEVNDFVKNNIKSIMFNVIEIREGQRPKRLNS